MDVTNMPKDCFQAIYLKLKVHEFAKKEHSMIKKPQT